jgi:hypothetical protein
LNAVRQEGVDANNARAHEQNVNVNRGWHKRNQRRNVSPKQCIHLTAKGFRKQSGMRHGCKQFH